MNVVLLGDTHFGARKDSIAFQEHFEKFYDEVFFPYLIKHKIKKVIQLGDLFDSRKATNIRTLQLMRRIFIDKLAEHGIELWVLLGNHDQYYKDHSQPNALRSHLNHYPHVHIIDSPQTVKFGKVKFDLIPWICKENEKEIAEFIEKSDSPYLCGHLELAGFDMHKGMKNEHGSKADFLRKYETAFSGHYHTKSHSGNVQYLGTPYENSWSDCGDDKGFYSFDTLKGINTFIQNPYKMHHKIMYDDDLDRINIKQFDYDYYANSFVRVIIANREDIPHFENFIEALYNNANPLDISITDISVAYREVDIESIETQDPLTALMTTIDNDKNNLKGLDKKHIKKLANEIFQDALLLSHEQ